MEKYVIVYDAYNEETFTECLTMFEIASIIGCSDYNETSNHKVFRYNASTYQMEKLTVHVMHREHTVMLFDKYGNYVDDEQYEEH